MQETSQRSYLKKYVALALFASFFIWSAMTVNLNPKTLAEGLPNIVDFLSCMFPPNLSSIPHLLGPALETVQMAFLGTFFATVMSFPLAIFAASNITTSELARSASRGIIAFTRTVPDIVFALIFVTAVGLGPFPGTLAISFHSVGMLGKLYD